MWGVVGRYALAGLVGWPVAGLVHMGLTDDPFDESLASAFPMVVMAGVLMIALDRSTRRFLPQRKRGDD